MKDELKAMLFGLLAAQTKKTDDELQELLFEGTGDEEKLKPAGLKLLVDMDVARVAKLKISDDGLKAIQTEYFDKGHSKAKGEVMATHEKSILTKYGIQSDLQGLELIDHVIDIKSDSSGKKGEITDDDVEKHPVYLKLRTDHKTEVDKINVEWKAKDTERETNHVKSLAFGDVTKLTQLHWESQKAVFSDDATIAQNTKQVILDKLNSFSYTKQGDTFVPTDAEGKAIDDGHGHPVTLDDHIKKHTSALVSYQTAKQRNSGGGDGDTDEGDKTKVKYTGVVPKNDDEFIDLMKKATPEEQVLINNAYQESKSA